MSIMSWNRSREAEVPEGLKDQELGFECSPAVRALLDHIAQELAREFVKLMRASACPESDRSPEEER